MRGLLKNSYKRYYFTGLIAILLLVILTICNYMDRRVYKVYIEDRLVGITADGPEIIERTYNEVKAKKYAQGSGVIDENITITEDTAITNQQLVDQEELARRLYVELDEEETISTVSNIGSNEFERRSPIEIIYVEDSTLYVGESRVLTEGKEEVAQITFQEVVGKNGQTSKEVVKNAIVEEAEPRIIAVGTKEKPDYIMPVEEYELSSPFGPRWGRAHEGIDLAISTGTEVLASADGVVIQSGWNGGYGISIYVDHGDGVITRYGHLSQAYAQVGRNVKQGETIGLSGNTGNSTGPHLHFEIRIGGVAVNPANYVEVEY